MKYNIRNRLMLTFTGLAIGPLLLVGIVLANQVSSVVAEKPLSIALVTVTDQILIIATTAIVTLLVAFGVALFVIRQSVEPLQRLAETGQEVEKTLRENEAQLLEVQRVAQIGWWRWDIATNQVEWSEQIFLIFGVPLSVEVDFDLYQSLVHPEDLAGVLQNIQDAFAADDGAYKVEHRIIRPDGQIRYIAGRGQVSRSETGQPLTLVGVAQDITERKQAEMALKRSEEDFRLLLTSLSAHVYMTEVTNDGHYRNRYISPKIEEISGYSVETITADWQFWATKMIHPEDQAKATIQAERLALGQDSDVEYRMIRADGRIIWVHDSARVKYEGETKIIFGLVSDITTTKLAQERLQESEAHLAEAQQIAKLGSWSRHMGPDAVEWSEQQRQIFGVSPTIEITYDFYLAIIHPDDRARIQQINQEVAESDQDLVTATYRIVHQDGQILHVSDVAHITRDEQGRAIKMVGVTQDITERYQGEEMLRRAKEEAEVANQAKSQFLSNMTHELRTPMNGVIGMTSLLFDTHLSREQLDIVNTIRSSGDTLLTLINDILDFSKIEANKLDLEAMPFDLQRCIEDTLDLVTPKAAEKGLYLSYFIEATVPAVIIQDVTRLRQILANLLTNAVKFTEQGEVTILVQVEQADPHFHQLHFLIKDSGIGIPADRLDRLFQSFSQVDASTTRRFGGTGLGLAISKRLSELMGGTMWVESEEGSGSTFHFTIRSEVVGVDDLTLRPDLSTLQGKHVLILEGNEMTRRFLEQQLQTWQMLPTLVSSPDETRLFQPKLKQATDVLILDLQLFGEDQATQLNKIWECYRNVPTVIVTSLGQRIISHYTGNHLTTISKPIKASHLHDALVTVMYGQHELPDKIRYAKFDAAMAQEYPLRILLAEDNVINQKVALGFLSRIGYRADVAANGQEVLEAVGRQTYDVILMDVNMPEMDGVEATRRIRRQWPPDVQPRIIAMTANAMQGDREVYLQAGMDDYVSKPIRVQDLIEALLRASAKPEASGEPVLAEAAPDDEPLIFDERVLDDFALMMGEDGPELVVELIGLFLEDTPPLLQALEKGLVEANTEAIRQAAHTLKSTSASLGAIQLSSLCLEIETLSKTGNITAAPEKIALAQPHYERVKGQLEIALETWGLKLCHDLPI